MLTALIVLARVVANPVSNAFQKRLTQRGANPVFVIAVTHALLTLVALPVLVAVGWGDLGPGFWPNMAISAVLAVVGNVLLVQALRRTDLSVLGPVNAYKAVLSLGLAAVLLGEIPTAAGAAGVFLILAGSYFVIDPAPDRLRGSAFVHFFRDRGVQLRLAALVLSATEAVFLKRAILSATPLVTFLYWSVLALPVAAAALLLVPGVRTRRQALRFRRNWRTYLWLALTIGLTQAATLFAFGALQVGYALALFQLSTLVSVFLGYRYFAERNVRRRLVGSVVMVAGAALVVALGRPG